MSEVIESTAPNHTERAQPAETEGVPPAETVGVEGAETGSKEFPRWLRQLEQLLPICSQFLVEGNIRDVHLIRSEDGVLLLPVVQCLWELLRDRGCEGLVIYDRVSGFRVFPQDRRQEVERKAGASFGSRRGNNPQPLEEVQRQLYDLSASRDLCCAVVMDYASRLVRSGDHLDGIEFEFFAACQKLADTTHELRRPQGGRLVFNPIFWLVDRANDLPAWFAVGNDRIRTVVVDSPDQQVRLAVAERLARDLPGVDEMSDHDRSNATHVFASQTSGLTVRAMMQIRSLARSQDLPFAQIGDAIRSYRVGITDNPWRQEYLYDRIRSGESEITKSVKGQTRAVQQTIDILKRSVTGLSAAQASSSGNKPRGILFFAGPTGVGKTELAKAVTNLLFGDQRAYIRFDMSEFSSDHSEARLIGAPPGYLGHDAGGELVNAVRQRPFSVVLFDEIEKAHPQILDKFLQILDDGRLTDGRGDTVYFSETVIIFTSNLGVYVRNQAGEPIQNVSQDDDYEDVSKKIQNAIGNHFRFKLQRPELLNRIGDNIVVFDFIRADLAGLIMDKMIGNIIERVREEHDVTLVIGTQAHAVLVDHCLSDLTHGGRGIGNRLESVLINPLARALFDFEFEAEQTITVDQLLYVDGIFEASLK